jgi:hypothetical protein
MATSLLNSSLKSIEYVGVQGDSSILTISDSPESGAMLVESVSVSASRGVQLRHFLNGGTAAFVGRGNGTVTISGLFGTADQMSNLLGSSNNDICKMSRTITLKSGLLKKCTNDGAVSTASDATITLHGCIVQGFTINKQLTQDGQVYETASVQMLLTDVTI